MHFDPRTTFVALGTAVLLGLGFTAACSDSTTYFGAGGGGGMGGQGGSAGEAGQDASAGEAGLDGAPATNDDGSAPAATPLSITIPQGATGLGPAAYGANPATVVAGTTVTWANQDSVSHTVTSDTAVFDSGTMAPGASYSFTFQAPGTYPYHCAIHGVQSMSGVILVQTRP